MFNFALLISLLGFESFKTYEIKNKALNHIDKNVCISKTYNIEAGVIKYDLVYMVNYCSLKKESSLDEVKRILDLLPDVTNGFLKAKNILNVKPCNFDAVIEMLEVNPLELKTNKKFESLNDKDSILLGVYDPYNYEVAHVTIVITDDKPHLISKIINHEFGHFLYEKLCLAHYTEKDSEEFAVEFESYSRRFK